MTSKQETSIFKDFTPTLQGKVSLVTGASRGIGRAIACHLAARGSHVILHARSKADLALVRSQIEEAGGGCTVQTVDARNEESINNSLVELDRQVDILVNNAGIYKTGSVQDHSTSDWDDTIKTNLYGPFFYSRAVLSDMLNKGWGRIINISSISGKVAEIHGAAYSASKFALNGFTQALALEVASKGITVNAICPGWVKTEMAKQQLEDEKWCKLNAIDPAESEEIARLSVPQMRFIEPTEVAELVAWLCSDAAKGITGQSINVCGGMCLS